MTLAASNANLLFENIQDCWRTNDVFGVFRSVPFLNGLLVCNIIDSYKLQILRRNSINFFRNYTVLKKREHPFFNSLSTPSDSHLLF